MKNILLISLCVVSFISCSPGNGGKGNLELEIEPFNAEGYTMPSTPPDVVSLYVRAVSSLGEEFTLTSTDVSKLSLPGLQADLWTVTAEGRNPDEKTLFQGEITIRVDSGKTASGNIALNPAPGKGRILLEIDLPDGTSATGVTIILRKGTDSEVQIPVTLTGGIGTYEGEYDSGVYMMTVVPPPGEGLEQIVYEAVVLPSESTVASYLPGSGQGSPSGGGNPPVNPDVTRTQPLIADHTAVMNFNRIPASYIEAARRLFVSLPGESHARAFLYGLDLLERQDSRYSADAVWNGAPGPFSGNLQVSRTYWTGRPGRDPWDVTVGEQDTWTHPDAVARLIGHLTYHSDNLGRPVGLFGWMWCWDMFEINYSSRTGWGGRIFTTFESRDNSPQVGPWELTSETRVSLEDYFLGMETAAAAHPETVVMYITGPVDRGGNTGGPGYQRWLKNERIRSFVRTYNKVLFDYEDILSWNYSADSQVTSTWNGTAFPIIAPDNVGEYAGESGLPVREGSGHISRQGSIRIAQALWWLLARLSGWEG